MKHFKKGLFHRVKELFKWDQIWYKISAVYVERRARGSFAIDGICWSKNDSYARRFRQTTLCMRTSLASLAQPFQIVRPKCFCFCVIGCPNRIALGVIFFIATIESEQLQLSKDDRYERVKIDICWVM